jgi:D-threo-aldose 1-dehydrogenase
MPDHGLNQRGHNTFRGPGPAGVRGTHYARRLVRDQYRRTVRDNHTERQPGSVGEHSVQPRRTGAVWLGHISDVGTVYLSHRHDSIRETIGRAAQAIRDPEMHRHGVSQPDNVAAVRTNKLGRSAVEVTQLGFGGGPLGGLYAPVTDDDAARALQTAWDNGIRYFDTSPHYGLGHSERLIGEFLRHQPRDEFALSTKVGRLLVPQDAAGRMDPVGFRVPAAHRRVWDFTRDGVRRSVEDSLTRMGLDRIDVLFLHDAEEHFEDALRDGYAALAELRAEGVVGAIGAGMYDTTMLTRLVRETDVDVLMQSGRSTLLEHSAFDELLPLCAERGVSVIAASVFQSGLLATPRPTEDAQYDYAPASPEMVQRVQRIADVCEAHGVTVPQVAMAFPLRHPAVVGIVVGMRSAEEARRNVELFDADIPVEVWDDLN